MARRSVDSALAAILNSTTPLFVCLISLLWTRHEPLTFGRLLGVSAGLTGVVLIAGASSLSGLGQSTAFGQAAIILASVSSAVAAIQGRRLNDVAPELAAAGTLTCGAVILVPLCLLWRRHYTSTPSAGFRCRLACQCRWSRPRLGSVIYFRLIRTIGSMGTTSVRYLKPAVGVLIGCTLMGEAANMDSGDGFVSDSSRSRRDQSTSASGLLPGCISQLMHAASTLNGR